MIRAIQKFMKGERVYMPGEFIDENEFDKEEIQELIEVGYLVVKIVAKKKPNNKKKVKHAKNS